MYFYYFTVAQNGRFFFRTDRDGIQHEDHANRVYEEMKKRFPESDGYTIGFCRVDNPRIVYLNK